MAGEPGAVGTSEEEQARNRAFGAGDHGIRATSRCTTGCTKLPVVRCSLVKLGEAC